MTQGAYARYTKDQKRAFARKLRACPTPAEKILWPRLQALRERGIKFRRQSLVLGYIADFYSAACKLVIEVDGSIHDLPYLKIRDAIRDRRMEAAGLRVLRVKNWHVTDSIEKTMAIITRLCSTKTRRIPGRLTRGRSGVRLAGKRATKAVSRRPARPSARPNAIARRRGSGEAAYPGRRTDAKSQFHAAAVMQGA